MRPLGADKRGHADASIGRGHVGKIARTLLHADVTVEVVLPATLLAVAPACVPVAASGRPRQRTAHGNEGNKTVGKRVHGKTCAQMEGSWGFYRLVQRACQSHATETNRPLLPAGETHIVQYFELGQPHFFPSVGPSVATLPRRH